MESLPAWSAANSLYQSTDSLGRCPDVVDGDTSGGGTCKAKAEGGEIMTAGGEGAADTGSIRGTLTETGGGLSSRTVPPPMTPLRSFVTVFRKRAPPLMAPKRALRSPAGAAIAVGNPGEGRADEDGAGGAGGGGGAGGANAGGANDGSEIADGAGGAWGGGGGGGAGGAGGAASEGVEGGGLRDDAGPVDDGLAGTKLLNNCCARPNRVSLVASSSSLLSSSFFSTTSSQSSSLLAGAVWYGVLIGGGTLELRGGSGAETLRLFGGGGAGMLGLFGGVGTAAAGGVVWGRKNGFGRPSVRGDS